MLPPAAEEVRQLWTLSVTPALERRNREPALDRHLSPTSLCSALPSALPLLGPHTSSTVYAAPSRLFSINSEPEEENLT